jgi:hypothetical protein
VVAWQRGVCWVFDCLAPYLEEFVRPLKSNLWDYVIDLVHVLICGFLSQFVGFVSFWSPSM